MPNVDKTTAERLVFISVIGWLQFEPAVLVRTGESYWVDWDQRLLVVEDQSGQRRSFTALSSDRPDAIR